MAKVDTRIRILEAARVCLLSDGYAAMSTRKVAVEASVPLSQIHYHFGSKADLILAVLRSENDSLLDRQAKMFSEDLPLSKRWDMACDFLDQDLESGYVRVLHEMMAAGWSSEAVGAEVRSMLMGWTRVLLQVAESAEKAGIRFGILTPDDVVALVVAAFLGSESMILLGFEGEGMPLRQSLRRMGVLIKGLEEGTE
ncbi:MAG: TetR/AcrR family transcriptional regulator [Actinomycetota bacterium]